MNNAARSLIASESIIRLYEAARIRYSEVYIRMYSAYNAWYREITGSMNDREAIAKLKRRGGIWEDYLNGTALHGLRPLMLKLADMTQHRPLGATAYWAGSLCNKTDWPSLIEYWYQVRCIVVHGGYIDDHYIQFAYETLYVFMQEITSRAQDVFADYALTDNGQPSSKSPQFLRNIGLHLATSADMWHVDMKRSL